MTICYLNSEYLPLEKAQISVLDRGFLFGDGVYEVIPFYEGRGFGLDEHLDRLNASLAKIHIANPLTHEEWKTIFARLLQNQSDPNNSIYLQITRGAAVQRAHAFSKDLKPTVFAYASSFTPGKNANGIAAITTPDIRWQYCGIKSINLLPNCLATQAALDAEAQETIFIEDDKVTEGAISNIFVVKNKIVYTAPATGRILNGVTRQFVIRLLNELAIPIIEEAVSTHFLENADEIWSTSSTREVVPVIRLNQKTIGAGQPGPIAHQIMNAYREKINTLINQPT